MAVDAAENVRAYALMRTIVGACAGLGQVMESMVRKLGTPQSTRHFALSLLDPIYRSCQLVRIAGCESYVPGLSAGQFTMTFVADLKRAAGSKVPADHETTRRMRNRLESAAKKVRGLQESVSTLAPKRSYDQVGMDPGHSDPFSLTSQIDYNKKLDTAKKRTYRTFAAIFEDFASFYEAGAFQKEAVRNMRKLSSALRKAASRV